MKKAKFLSKVILLLIISYTAGKAQSQSLRLGGYDFQLRNISGSIIQFKGDAVLKIERDLNAIPFDVSRLESTVDEPTYAKIFDLDLENGIVEVKMFSEIQDPSPFQGAQGFIGIAYRINSDDTAFECIYLRPRVGRSDNQSARNHTVQYYAYPNHKFQKLRNESPGKYETTAPVNIGEWITMRLEIEREMVHMFINNAKYSTFVVDKMLGETTRGTIGLWVDIGTIGYFKDLKVIRK